MGAGSRFDDEGEKKDDEDDGEDDPSLEADGIGVFHLSFL
jgi:hypothetical protein